MHFSEEELRKEREGLVSQRDLAFANYHRLSGAVGIIDTILNRIGETEPEPLSSNQKVTHDPD